ncbi:hypothetical protein TCAL_04351 [Tigriopus californicus]|uniref:Carboxylesterase type B domain-containing protein n=2 Tax=Tigriopus californicus TaxID=6832 RepID=A0A553NPV1_TIGCA|nr:hypothetical protein TCAL_04351 [Tigriopus californicus]
MLLILGVVLSIVISTVHATRVTIQQGSIEGDLVSLSHLSLPNVNVYRGIPFARPPVGSKRFVPPVSPVGWSGTRKAVQFQPVCPQVIPDLRNETAALLYMTKGNLAKLRSIFPMLTNQSEDCLYLNVYTPEIQVARLLPVMILIHGQSFEWGSGNVYDPSIFSSFGSVIVVTVNYRLGAFGFLQTGLNGNGVNNFGLLDILAAIEWVKKNIGAFGGDANAISILGHGTGATLLSLLMISPIVANRGLFHRTLLISGSPLSPMAFPRDPEGIARQLFEKSSCPYKIHDNSNNVDCMRKQSVNRILSIQVDFPLYTIPFGPISDGIIPPKPFDNLMREAFHNYDAIFGVVEEESSDMMTDAIVQYGMTEFEQREMLTQFFRNNFARQHTGEILKSILNEYTHYKASGQDPQEFGRMTREILSDAITVGPLLKMAKIHAESKRATYAYVFHRSRTSRRGDQVLGSLRGDDLDFMFGYPFLSREPLTEERQSDQSISQSFMTLIRTFVEGGIMSKSNGRFHREGYTKSGLSWPEFDIDEQQYLKIDSPIEIGTFYRYYKLTKLEEIASKFGKVLQSSRGSSSNPPGSPPSEKDEEKTDLEFRSFDSDPDIESGGMTMRTIIIIGFLLLILNVCFCAGVLYQKHRVRQRENNLQSQLRNISQSATFSGPNESMLYDKVEPHSGSNYAHLEMDQLHSSQYNILRRNQMRGDYYPTYNRHPHQRSDQPVWRSISDSEDDVRGLHGGSFRTSNSLRTVPRSGPDNLVIQSSESTEHVNAEEVQPKPRSFPKVLPDLPSVWRERRLIKRDSPQDPIIEMIPLEDYERLYPTIPPKDTGPARDNPGEHLAPVISNVNDSLAPGTLRRDRPVSSYREWCSQYSQSFLSKTLEGSVSPPGDE